MNTYIGDLFLKKTNNKKLVILLSLFLLISSPQLFGQRIEIHTESFETEGGYTASTLAVETDRKFFERKTTDDAEMNTFGTRPIQGAHGNYLWAVGHLDGRGQYVLIERIDISNHGDLQVIMKVAANDAEEFEGSDHLIVEVSFDGGAYTKIGAFYGKSTNNKRLRQDVDLSGGYSPIDVGYEIDESLTDKTFAITGTGNSLNIRIKAKTSEDKEQIVFDDIRLTGIPKVSVPVVPPADNKPPVASAPTNTPEFLRNGVRSTSTVQSTEGGNIYLFLATETTPTSQAEINTLIAKKKAFVGATVTNPNTPYTVSPPVGLEDGRYDIIAVDDAGNVSTSVTGWLTIDNTPPVVTVSGVVGVLKPNVASTSKVSSNEDGEIYLYLATESAPTTKQQLEALVNANRAYVVQSAAKANTPYALTLQEAALRTLTDGLYNTVAVDPAGNVSPPKAWLTIDSTPPRKLTTGTVIATGGTVVAQYWNSSNSGLDVTIPLSRGDASLYGGRIQIRAKIGSNAYEHLGVAHFITNVQRLAGNVTVNVAADHIKGINGYGQGKTVLITAVITDVVGYSTTLNESSDRIRIDTRPPVILLNEINFISETQLTFTLNESIKKSFATFTTDVGDVTTSEHSRYGNKITIRGTGFTKSTRVKYRGSGITDQAGNPLRQFDITVTENVVNMRAGHVAFTYYNANRNEFAFVILKDIPRNTRIKFTDNGWNKTHKYFGTSERTIVWQADRHYHAGLEVKITGARATAGIVTGRPLRLNTAGDQIFAYQGASTDPTFLAGIHNNGPWNNNNNNDSKSQQPRVLNVGHRSSLYIQPKNNNVAYTRSKTAGTLPEIRTAINNSGNWAATVSVPRGSRTSYAFPPNVTTLTPANGSTIAVATTTLQIHFNENINKVSKPMGRGWTFDGEKSVTLSASVGDPMPTTFLIDGDKITTSSTIASIDISGVGLVHGKTYKVDVRGFLFKNAEGNHNMPIDGATQWSFTVDGEAPEVVSITRNRAMSGVNANSGVATTKVSYLVKFSEPVADASVTAADFTPKGTASTGAASVTSVAASGGNTYIITVSGINKLGELTLDFTGEVDDMVGNKGGTMYDSGEPFVIIKPEPSGHVSNPQTIAQSDNSSLELSWTKATGGQPADGYLIHIMNDRQRGSSADPVDLIPQADTPSFNNGLKILNVSDKQSVRVAGLSSGKTYRFKIYPYTNSDNQINYKTAGVAEFAGTTSTAQSSSIAYSSSVESFSSLTNRQARAPKNFVFRIIDDGTSSNADGSPTLISQMVITKGVGNNIDWTDAIEGVEISDGTKSWNTDANPGITITDGAITFRNIPHASARDLGHIPDNNEKTYTLSIWLKTSLTSRETIDGSRFVFQVDKGSFTHPAGGSGIADGESASSDQDKNRVSVEATAIVWQQQPGRQIGVQALFTKAPTVKAVDANGNLDLDYTAEVSALTNGGNINMNNSPVGLAFVSGIVTFDDSFNYQTSGDGTLTMTSGTLKSLESDPVTVSYSDNTVVSQGPEEERAKIPSTYNAFVAGDYNFDINISDDAPGVIVNDKVPTRIEKMVFTAAEGRNASELKDNWNAVIENAVLLVLDVDGTVQSSHAISGDKDLPAGASDGGTITEKAITFTGIPNTDGDDLGYIADDATKNYRLVVWLKKDIADPLDNTIDGLHFNFKVGDVAVSKASRTSTMAKNPPAVTSGARKNVIEVIAMELRYAEQLAGTFINQEMEVVIEATDANGNRDKGYKEKVAVTSSGSMKSFENPQLSEGVVKIDIVHTATGGNLKLGIKEEPKNTLPDDAVESNFFDILPGSGKSDIIASSFAYPTNISYKDFVTTPVSNANPKVFEFEIHDGGKDFDKDKLPTNVTSLSFEIKNWSLLQTVGLFDSSDKLIDEVDAAENINFDLSKTPIIVPDDGKVTLHLRTVFTTTTTDNVQFSFEVSKAVANDQGSLFESDDGKRKGTGVAKSSTQDNHNRIEVSHSKLVYDNIPNNFIGKSFSPAIKITALDANDNVDLDFTEGMIKYSNASTNPGRSLTTINDPAGNFEKGVFAFPDHFQFTEHGEDVTITIETTTYKGLSAATSNSFAVKRSSQSNIDMADGFTALATIEYINFLGTDITGKDNAVEIARFSINDGGSGSAPDEDGSPSVIDGITFDIGNFDVIKRIAIYQDGTTEIKELPGGTSKVNFTGLNLSASDDGKEEFSVFVTFNEKEVSDHDLVQLIVKDIVAGTGSGFADLPDDGGARTSEDSNTINVTASKYEFIRQPGAIEGINIELKSIPEVKALDANNKVDMDINEVMSTTTFEIVTPGITDPSTAANSTCAGCSFAYGVSDFSNFRYTSVGDGTWTINDRKVGRSITKAESGAVDVVHTKVTSLNDATSNGVRSGTYSLNTGSVNVPILGFKLESLTKSAGEPTLNEVTIQFKALSSTSIPFDIRSVYENFRLFRSGNETIDLGKLADETLITGITTTLMPTSVRFTGLNEELDEATTNQNLFLVVNVTIRAANGSPEVEAFIEPANLIVTNGSLVLSDGLVNIANISGVKHTFVDEQNPVVVSRTPADGSINISPATDLVIVFNEPVTSLDKEITLRKPGDPLFNRKIPLTNTSADKKTFTFDPSFVLDQNESYYVQIEVGNKGTGKGFVDDSGNGFSGIQKSTGWNFKTSDATPPVFSSHDVEIKNQYDLGFNIAAKTNEKGTIYYLVTDLGAIPPTAAQVFDPATYPRRSLRASGTIKSLIPDKYHYSSVSDLSPSKNYTVFLTAQDEANPTPNRTTSPIKKDANTQRASRPGTVVDAANATICLGSYQPILSVINIRESANDDFSKGLDQVFNLVLSGDFEFKISSTSAKVTVSGGDISRGSLEFINKVLMKITYTINGTNTRDKITIQGLQIKATSANASGNIKRIGGTARQRGNGVRDQKIHATLSVEKPSVASFTFETGSASVANNAPDPVVMLPKSSLLTSGTNVFSGTGVVGNKFFPNTVGLGLHLISLVHTSELGCKSSFTTTITVFDNVSAIPGIKSKYCAGAPDVLIRENDKTGFRLTSLTLDRGVSPRKAASPAQARLTNVGNNYTLHIGTPATFTEETVYVKLTGTYVNKIDAADAKDFTKEISISGLPVSTLGLTPGFEGGPRNTHDFCLDGGDILLTGKYDKKKQPNGQNSFSFSSLRPGSPVNRILNFTENDENASVSPRDIQARMGYGDHEIVWKITNPNTTCSTTSRLKITVNQLPEAKFTRTNACKGLEISFTDQSTIPADDPTDNNPTLWNWDFDDLTSASLASQQSPKHTFANTGVYDVSLEVTTEKGCTSKSTQNIEVGANPIPEFTYSQIGTDKDTKFVNETSGLTKNPVDAVVNVEWIFEKNGAPLMITTNPLNQVTHRYTNPGVKEVTMTATTFNGCRHAVKKSIFVVPVVILNAAITYEESFDKTDGNWTPWGRKPSWIVAQRGGKTITGSSDTDAGQKNFWVTGTGTYKDEASYLYSPIFDISGLSRPLIAFNNFVDMNSSDGVYLEYSTNGFFGTWKMLGALNSGIKWYGAKDISSFNMLNLANNRTSVGWSETNSGWRDSRHSLSDIPEKEKKRVQFRLSFISGAGNKTRDGFAFDNFRIGERTRTVLVENFTNTFQRTNIRSESNFLNNTLVKGRPNGVEIIRINYHTDFPGEDPVNSLNPTDHGARSAYYNIASIPQAVLDGDTRTDLFSTWGETAFGQRSLALAEFEIAINPTIPDPADGILHIEIAVAPFTAVLRDKNDVILNVALIQDSQKISGVNSGETELYNVVKDLLPGATGTLIPHKETLSKFTRSFTWIPVNTIDLKLLSIVAFVQDEEKKTVYQSAILKSNDPTLRKLAINPVTATDRFSLPMLSLYPNPANDQVTISFGRRTGDKYQLNIYDQFGKLVSEQAIAQGTEKVSFDTHQYVNGCYFINIASADRVIARQKLIILKQ